MKISYLPDNWGLCDLCVKYTNALARIRANPENPLCFQVCVECARQMHTQLATDHLRFCLAKAGIKLLEHDENEAAATLNEVGRCI